VPLSPYRTGREFPQFLALFFAVWSLRATVGTWVDEQLSDDGTRQAYALISQALLWLVPAVFFAVAIRGDKPRDSLRLGWPDLSRRGSLTFAVGLAALTITAWITLRQHDTTADVLGLALARHGLAVALWSFPAVCCEEVLFRGMVLTEMCERLRFWAANAMTALLFTAAYWPHWWWTREFDRAFLWDSAGVFAIGLVAGFLTRRTASIWPAVICLVLIRCLAGVW